MTGSAIDLAPARRSHFRLLGRCLGSLVARSGESVARPHGPPPLDAAIVAHGIRKSYGELSVLRDASLTLHRGEAVAIIGENGVGKSTLLRICAGFLAPDAGAVWRRGRVGHCPQQPELIDFLTAAEHLVLFGRAAGRDRATALREGRRALDELGFSADEATLAGELSGGTRQKLNLALALLGDPEVLLLDEPYQGFDHGTYVDFWERVSDWRDEGRAIAIVTHMLTELWRVDRVVELGSHGVGTSASEVAA